jgi:hypothetical protein
MSTPKTETSAMPNPFASFADPVAMWTASQQAFAKMMTEGYGHYAALESQMIARANAAVATWAQLTQDAIAYSAQLSAEARKLGLDAVTKLRA